MQILTLDQEAFAGHCRRLEEATRDYAPDLVVGVATGGTYMLPLMYAGIAQVSVLCQRPSTASKAGWRGRAVRCLPRWMADLARKAEARLLAGRKAAPSMAPLAPEVVKAVKGAKRVLVVDDAVDSGATLRTVADALAQIAGERQMRSAVITVTTANPLIRPDYTLYDNATLIRFPWSLDAH